MLKCKGITLIALIAVLISGRAYCQQDTRDQQVNTVSGKVIAVEPEGGFLSVQTDNNGNMVFHIPVESVLYRKTQPMASIEIKKDDPVKIQYIVTPAGRNDIIKLVDSQPASY